LHPFTGFVLQNIYNFNLIVQYVCRIDAYVLCLDWSWVEFGCFVIYMFMYVYIYISIVPVCFAPYACPFELCLRLRLVSARMLWLHFHCIYVHNDELLNCFQSFSWHFWLLNRFICILIALAYLHAHMHAFERRLRD
jgi:hypothetical protein